ncbi:DNA-directed RNA polymerase I subunit 1 [Camellia sinensis]|uniref:DNA-directed RNA polymerase I subunit 1 n=1 Tax=Camellia sinensis TaxID=4442 RepID=UPI001035FEAF|nr:DNA-directed RNA polymerase I subunit 1 [Camellia sinensis]
MAHTTEGASESVEVVRFSFMTDEEVKSHSVVKVTNPILLDNIGRPIPGGLYDLAMGPLDEQSPCKTCGQRSFHCPGHCGHIDLITSVYNPLMFDMLHYLLQRTCFFCLHFRASRSQVEKCALQLELIAKGDIVGAKRLDSLSSSESIDPGASEHGKQGWTSVQFTEAMSVLNKFLKPNFVACKNCNAKNPKISKPTFGWFHMGGLSAANTRANIIRGCKLGGPRSGENEENASPEVVNVDDCPLGSDLDTAETDSLKEAVNGIEDSRRERHGRKKGERVSREFSKQKNFFSGTLLPSEVKDIVKLLWENEAHLCTFICDIQREQCNTSGNRVGYSMFFLETILVPPIKFRPAAKSGDSVMEHPQTVLLSDVLQSNIALGNAYVNNSERSKIVNRWMDLQQSVNILFDGKNTMRQGKRELAPGICQLLDKKEGIFRQKMMGKRVNFACRSVISPDPYLAVNEIGIPPYFALRLTYPERLTPWNVVNLRDAIVNGSEIYPGATHYVDKLSTVKLPPSKKMRLSISRKLPSSRGVVTQYGKSCDYEFEGKIVYRHLRDGDVVLVNRQPTLHKPSIMAHVVRVLKGEKTLRMHYANCSTYNADFDGDEINVHLPQDEISRAEAYNIVNANHQYIVPTRGDTVRGLIQDHIVSAVILTMKDTFLTHDQFNQLLYGSGVFAAGCGSSFAKPCQKISTVDSEALMQPVLPAIWKPKPLWTGKQVITALLNHLTRDYTPFTVEKDGKIPSSYFGSQANQKHPSKGRKNEESGEHMLLIWKNELVHGVIDKAQFGKYGLVHTVQELYGSNTAGILLSALSRLFTVFLQIHGFTCGVDDLMILADHDEERKKKLDGEDVGEEVHCDFFKFKPGTIGPMKLQLEIEKAIHNSGQSATASMDLKMKNRLHEKTSDINKDLLVKGLLKPFPKNCISLMTISGAKGSTVNFQQISSCLGQQELEGKRVPRMVSGKTLPCFPPWHFSSRAGGFISDRFLTGLRPQEYYFHCMAGREGLVDTAVKTSRSGYLQRCLVKNMECLKVCYDYTVRDADGSIIQFTYGEDGVDVHQTSFIAKFGALAANQAIIGQKFHQQLEFNNYITELPEGLTKKVQTYIEELKIKDGSVELKEREELLKLVRQKYISSLAHSGEPVGVIAAQSVGEPSTQMTLNTFHLAGRGEMNVTLGIPRLQEILMTASNDIKTPIMTCPLLEGRLKKDAERLVRKIKKVTVADIIESMEESVLPVSINNNQISRIYKLKMKLCESQLFSIEDYEETMGVLFMRQLEDAIQSHLLLLSRINGIKNFMPDSRSMASDEIDEDASSNRLQGEENDDDHDDDEGADDLGSDVQKRKQQAADEMDYEDGSEDEPNEGETMAGLEKETDQAEDEEEVWEDDEIEIFDNEDEASEMPVPSEPKSSDKKGKSKLKSKSKVKAKLVKKDFDKAIFIAAEGLDFEVHFRFSDEPHILLGQIAQRTAKKVHIKSSGKLDMCQAIKSATNDQVLWKSKDDKKKDDPDSLAAKKDDKDELGPWALKTAGVNFTALWEMQDDIDVTRIYSNNIHAILSTYGVEAARETILREVKHVFQIYGVEIDYRHLSLIAEFMTHSGGYRPMSRHGGIAESISPLLKMSFETASKFIVEAASHGMSDNLETPSSRICLGLPVKMGTGCFDLMQKLEI